MAYLNRILSAATSALCRHEWTSKHEPHRLYLECLNCGRTTHGIEIGRRTRAVVEPHAQRRRPGLAVLRPDSSRAA